MSTQMNKYINTRINAREWGKKKEVVELGPGAIRFQGAGVGGAATSALPSRKYSKQKKKGVPCAGWLWSWGSLENGSFPRNSNGQPEKRHLSPHSVDVFALVYCLLRLTRDVEEALRQCSHRQAGGQSRGQKHGRHTGPHSDASGGTADDEHVHEGGQTLADDGSGMEEEWKKANEPGVSMVPQLGLVCMWLHRLHVECVQYSEYWLHKHIFQGLSIVILSVLSQRIHTEIK